MCAQAGKTEGLILNTIGFYMSYHPASIMAVSYTHQMCIRDSFKTSVFVNSMWQVPFL